MYIGVTYIKSTVCKVLVIYAVGHILGLKAEHILPALRVAAIEGMRLVK